MEEKILKIINKRVIYTIYRHKVQSTTTESPPIKDVSADYRDVAKEISSHVFEFIEWLNFGSHDFYRTSECGYDGYGDDKTGLILTPTEIYEYWLTKIKK